MGAGLFPAGSGFLPAAGAPGVVPPPATTLPTLPVALYFDPTIPGFVMNADGTMASVHPVDQKMALALFVEYGSIPSAPTVGSKFRQLARRIDPKQLNAVVGAEITRVTWAFVTANEVQILGYQALLTGSGRLAVYVAYANLLDPRWTPAAANFLKTNVAGRTLSGFVN